VSKLDLGFRFFACTENSFTFTAVLRCDDVHARSPGDSTRRHYAHRCVSPMYRSGAPDITRSKSPQGQRRCRSISALTGHPVIASGIDNRSRMVVALCGASNGRWTTTVRRNCGASRSAQARDYEWGVGSRASEPGRPPIFHLWTPWGTSPRPAARFRHRDERWARSSMVSASATMATHVFPNRAQHDRCSPRR
jgi:hypothetical protein